MCKPDKKMIQDFIHLWKSCLERIRVDPRAAGACCWKLDEEVGNLVDELIRECFASENLTKRFVKQLRHKFIKQVVLDQRHFEKCLANRHNPLSYLRTQARIFFNPDYYSGK
ncbi:MAG TPA: hypothetical protein PKI17_06780 [Syntrophomonas sp.]|nr:hypothetical protein [Syntrophomonas sp.]